MTIYRVETFGDIINSTSRKIKIPTTDAQFLEALKESINTRYQTAWSFRKWRWTRGRYDIRVPAKYTTGAVAVAIDNRQITFGGGAVLKAEHKNWFINITGTNEVYKIIAVNTVANTALLSVPYVGATNTAAAYKMFQYMYGLPPDCQEMDLCWHDHLRTPIEPIAPREFVDRAVANPFREGKCEAYTVSTFKAYEGAKLGEFVLGYDFLGGDDKNDQQILLYPVIPDVNYMLHFDYTMRLTPLENNTDKPLIPIERRHVLVLGALADMFYRERNNETGNLYERKFNDMLDDMVAGTEVTENRAMLVTDCRKYYSRAYNIRMSRGYRFDYD